MGQIPISPYSEMTLNPQFDNLWVIDFSKVNILSVTGNIPQTLQLQAKAASIPEHVIDSIPDGFINQQTNYAGFESQSGKTWEVTFLDIYDPADIRRIFEQWQKLIFDKTTFTQGYKKNYAFDLSVVMLDYNRQPFRKYVLYRAWPSSISAVSLTYPETGGAPTLVKPVITFTYDYQESLPLE